MLLVLNASANGGHVDAALEPALGASDLRQSQQGLCEGMTSLAVRLAASFGAGAWCVERERACRVCLMSLCV